MPINPELPPSAQPKPWPLTTQQECADRIQMLEVMIAQAQALLDNLDQNIYQRMPFAITITDATEKDMHALRDLIFHLTYTRDRIIVRIYEMQNPNGMKIGVVRE